MTYGAERVEQGEPVGSSARPGYPDEAREACSAPARETLSFIHALASEWEDERGRSRRATTPGRRSAGERVESPQPFRSARPGRAPVGAPASTTATPFTNTCTIPRG